MLSEGYSAVNYRLSHSLSTSSIGQVNLFWEISGDRSFLLAGLHWPSVAFQLTSVLQAGHTLGTSNVGIL